MSWAGKSSRKPLATRLGGNAEPGAVAIFCMPSATFLIASIVRATSPRSMSTAAPSELTEPSNDSPPPTILFSWVNRTSMSGARSAIGLGIESAFQPSSSSRPWNADGESSAFCIGSSSLPISATMVSNAPGSLILLGLRIELAVDLLGLARVDPLGDQPLADVAELAILVHAAVRAHLAGAAGAVDQAGPPAGAFEQADQARGLAGRLEIADVARKIRVVALLRRVGVLVQRIPAAGELGEDFFLDDRADGVAGRAVGDEQRRSRREVRWRCEWRGARQHDLGARDVDIVDSDVA